MTEFLERIARALVDKTDDFQIRHYLRGTNAGESCSDLTVATLPLANEPEALSSLAFFLPAAIAAFSVSKPFAVAATTLFESRIS
jgi:hypothetical protein